MYEINFIAYAYDKDCESLTYSSFLIPFAFFALQMNDNSHVEIVVEDASFFKENFFHEITLLEKINNNFLIREYQNKHNNHIPNTYRFFEVPTVDAVYTYISDIDIMFLEKNMVKLYENIWKENHLPYYNILRYDNSVRLTGVHIVKSKDYFTKQFLLCQKETYQKCENGKKPIDDDYKNDEITLGRMCKSTFGLPDIKNRLRPIYGIHFSPNRGKDKRMGLKTSELYYNKFMEIASKHEELFIFPSFKNLLVQLNEEFEIV